MRYLPSRPCGPCGGRRLAPRVRATSRAWECPGNRAAEGLWVPFGPYRVPEPAGRAILSGALGRGGAQIAQIGPGAPESAGRGSEAGSWAEIPASRRPAREGGDSGYAWASLDTLGRVGCYRTRGPSLVPGRHRMPTLLLRIAVLLVALVAAALPPGDYLPTACHPWNTGVKQRPVRRAAPSPSSRRRPRPSRSVSAVAWLAALRPPTNGPMLGAGGSA